MSRLMNFEEIVKLLDGLIDLNPNNKLFQESYSNHVLGTYKIAEEVVNKIILNYHCINILWIFSQSFVTPLLQYLISQTYFFYSKLLIYL